MFRPLPPVPERLPKVIAAPGAASPVKNESP